eukprot:TRINITY_DN66429_c5_g8_i1.p1 TRINITY_DN66429_c5_g8~~TRINITY_DN66429_c5_g8_i1.p1  ORF type:complete len:346 (-),score=19.73 TRINITY_DN66429_c5_g8_i1:82-1119(-)
MSSKSAPTPQESRAAAAAQGAGGERWVPSTKRWHRVLDSIQKTPLRAVTAGCGFCWVFYHFWMRTSVQAHWAMHTRERLTGEFSRSFESLRSVQEVLEHRDLICTRKRTKPSQCAVEHGNLQGELKILWRLTTAMRWHLRFWKSIPDQELVEFIARCYYDRDLKRWPEQTRASLADKIQVATTKLALCHSVFEDRERVCKRRHPWPHTDWTAHNNSNTSWWSQNNKIPEQCKLFTEELVAEILDLEWELDSMRNVIQYVDTGGAAEEVFSFKGDQAGIPYKNPRITDMYWIEPGWIKVPPRIPDSHNVLQRWKAAQVSGHTNLQNQGTKLDEIRARASAAHGNKK